MWCMLLYGPVMPYAYLVSPWHICYNSSEKGGVPYGTGQRQTQQLTQQTLQSLALLQMSTVELEAYVQELAQENPIIDLEPPRSEQEAPRDQELFRRVKWLEDSDRQNRYYQRLDAEELDPLAQVGTDGGLEESLSIFSSARSSSSIWMSLPSSFCATCPPVWTRMGISASHWTSSPGLLASPKGGSPALWSYCAPWNPQVWGASSLSQCLSFSCSASMRRAPPLPLFGTAWRSWPKTLSCHLRPPLHLSEGGPVRRTADPS